MTETGHGKVDDGHLNALGEDGVADPVHAITQLPLARPPHQDVLPVQVAVLKLERRLGRSQRQGDLLDHRARLAARVELSTVQGEGKTGIGQQISSCDTTVHTPYWSQRRCQRSQSPSQRSRCWPKHAHSTQPRWNMVRVSTTKTSSDSHTKLATNILLTVPHEEAKGALHLYALLHSRQADDDWS